MKSTRAPAGLVCCQRLLRVEGRRHDGVRLLDLQRRLPRAGPQPGRRTQAHRQPAAAGMGLRLAAQPPGHVQPRLGRPRRPALVGAEEARSGGTRRSAAGWASIEPDFEPDKPPDYRPPPGATGMAAIAGDQPFIMKPDGLGWLYAPVPSRTAPCRRTTSRSSRRWATCSIPSRRATRRCVCSRGRSTTSPTRRRRNIPVVATTFRLTEHYLSGPMSRFNSWLNELQPEMFVELSSGAGRRARHRPRRLADGAVAARPHRGPRHGDAAAAAACSSRGASSTRSACRSTGPSPARVVGGNANDLTSLVADPNVSMHECKAFACQVHAGRLGRPRRRNPTVTPAPWPTRDPVPDTPAAAQPEGRFGHGK